MDWDDVWLAYTIGVVVALGLALKAVIDAALVRSEFAGLRERLSVLDRSVARLAARLDQTTATPEPSAPATAEPVTAPAEAAEAAAVPEEAAASPAPAPMPAAPPAAPRKGWEQLLVEHWLVWLGGAAMALGGAFLVKLSIDEGLLTPLVRVVLGIMLGIGLVAAAEWVGRHDVAEDGEPAAASYVPQALAAAGAATIFASLYAAYALYGFLASGPAFVLLALTAGATVVLSLRQGPLVAALGLIGAFVVPLLVESAEPHALPLFAYLAVVTAGVLVLLRYRAWWWLAWPSLVGAIFWVLLWLANVNDPETPVVALYLLVLFGLFVAFRRGIARIGFLAGIADTKIVRVVTRAAFWAIAFAFVVLAEADASGSTSIGAATLTLIGLMVFAYRDSQLDDAVAVAGALALALLASWTLPLPVPELSLWVFKLEPDHIADFTIAATVFTMLLGGGGFLLMPRVARPGRWAAVSAAVPLLVLVIAYWRLQKFELNIAWTLAALALAGLELSAAAVVARERDTAPDAGRELDIALAAYAVGVLGSTILAATLALGEAWLTVALALHLPAIGWIEGRIRLPALRWLALGVAAIVLIRLVLNPYVLDYPIGPTPVFNWLLYGYGVPALSFIVATRQFGSRADDLLVAVLEAGSALFSLLLLSLEVTHAAYGSLDRMPLSDFSTGALLIALWLVFAAVLLAIGERRRRPVLRWGGMLVLGAATLVNVAWQPLWLLFSTSVGDLPILDALLFADLVPAAVYAVVAWLSPFRVVRIVMRGLAAVFAFAWMTLEIQHLFHGRVELFSWSTEAEWYCYSVAWLAYAAAVLSAGLWWRNQWLRRAGLIGIGLVIAKVFLSDMAELDGVLRALSFLGLGGALLGVGYAYRRLRPV